MYDPRTAIEGAGPPLVYVPGMDGTGLLFYRQIPALSRRYRVVTYTLRDAGAHMSTLVEDLARVVRRAEALGLRRVGLGMGAERVKKRFRGHPEQRVMYAQSMDSFHHDVLALIAHK